MSFLSNLNLGGTSNSYQPQITSFLGNAASQSQNKGFDSGDAANMALDAAASAIPFGAMAKKLLDNLGLQKNIDNVLKHGLSSWGASTSPEEAEQEMAKNVAPWIIQKTENINAQNAEQTLNELEITLGMHKYFFEKLLRHHSKAKSTRKANQWWVKQFTQLRKDVIGKMVTQLRGAGVVVKTTAITGKPSDYNIPDMTDGDGIISDHDVNSLPLSFIRYSLDFSKIKQIEVDKETGEITAKKSGFGSLIGLAGLGYAAKEFLPQIVKAIK
ncbi:hypothetical protein [Zunongwangia profunda]|uniref:Uncharacterized protein n=2 Tax=Zunongwangia profunda TaxID=398743 RepID=D5BF96_ZUNPS|nr:hypothetical protein [Zunongwangia profunda]ADF52994.1 hypothetical protein ZPR_2672 [Zunongwangia profunda SM-A87]MAS70880.1 hypothetical protein [Zunongwangia sp.]HCV79691.1 hypothetical protein [Zunongwangia profunda]|tara:strand:- start:2032 stop:2844 length:813 start_codon:yes stop_codon:yes gene_type:complete